VRAFCESLLEFLAGLAAGGSLPGDVQVLRPGEDGAAAI
jgi:hypothetical protein